MGETAETASEKHRGRPFQKGTSGNPAGRPPGARNRATMAAEALLDGDAEALTRKAVDLALDGDVTALRLCLERICPPRRDRPMSFALPPLETAADAPKAIAAIVAAVADGTVTASEAAELATLVERFVKTVEVAELEARIVALEERTKQ